MSTNDANELRAMEPYRVVAFNTAAASENKIHDDAVASSFGFAGALVPGVSVFGYLAHAPVARWGRDWLARGHADCRFGLPVYDGHVAVVDAVEQAGQLDLTLSMDGQRCATGTAALPAAPPSVDLAAFRSMIGTTNPPPERPPASDDSLREGRRFRIAPVELTREFSEQWVDAMRETDPIYRTQGLAHPALLLRIANWVLTQNVVLGPWIHSGSVVQNLAAMPVGSRLDASGIVQRNYEHKGHRFVQLDIVVTVDEHTPAARITHTAIWLPRQVTQARH